MKHKPSCALISATPGTRECNCGHAARVLDAVAGLSCLPRDATTEAVLASLDADGFNIERMKQWLANAVGAPHSAATDEGESGRE